MKGVSLRWPRSVRDVAAASCPDAAKSSPANERFFALRLSYVECLRLMLRRRRRRSRVAAFFRLWVSYGRRRRLEAQPGLARAVHTRGRGAITSCKRTSQRRVRAACVRASPGRAPVSQSVDGPAPCAAPPPLHLGLGRTRPAAAAAAGAPPGMASSFHGRLSDGCAERRPLCETITGSYTQQIGPFIPFDPSPDLKRSRRRQRFPLLHSHFTSQYTASSLPPQRSWVAIFSRSDHLVPHLRTLVHSKLRRTRISPRTSAARAGVVAQTSYRQDANVAYSLVICKELVRHQLLDSIS